MQELYHAQLRHLGSLKVKGRELTACNRNVDVIVILLLCAIILQFPYASSTSTPQTVTTGSGLHVDGRWIRDANGNVVQLRGASWEETLWSWPSLIDWTQEADRVKMLGVTLVRVSLNPQYWNESDYVPTIDKIVSLLAARQIYVILDFHEIKIDETYDDIANVIVNNASVGPFSNWIDFVKTLATRYKDYPYAAFIEFFGQPPHGTANYPLNVLEPAYYNSVLNAARQVHSINPNVLVTFGGVNSDGVGQIFIDNPLPEPNVVYGLHRYYHFDIGYSHYANSYAAGQFNLARQQMEQLYLSIGLVMVQKGYPVIDLEFGAYGSDPNWDTQIRDLYALLAKYRVGWVQWSYYDPTKPAANGSALTVDRSNLSPQGVIWAANVAASTTNTTSRQSSSTSSSTPLTKTYSTTATTTTDTSTPETTLPVFMLAATLTLVALGVRRRNIP
jgi:hypothetical protein